MKWVHSGCGAGAAGFFPEWQRTNRGLLRISELELLTSLWPCSIHCSFLLVQKHPGGWWSLCLCRFKPPLMLQARIQGKSAFANSFFCSKVLFALPCGLQLLLQIRGIHPAPSLPHVGIFQALDSKFHSSCCAAALHSTSFLEVQLICVLWRCSILWIWAICIYFCVLFFPCHVWDWTKGLIYARKVLYHSATSWPLLVLHLSLFSSYVSICNWTHCCLLCFYFYFLMLCWGSNPGLGTCQEQTLLQW